MYSDQNDKTVDKENPFYKLYGHAHESIYQDLTTIIPHHFFTFKDFCPTTSSLHPNTSEVIEYLQKYASHFDIEKYIEFDTAVVEVARADSDKWAVTTTRDNASKQQLFDYVVVCNGHNSIPYVPLESVKGLDKFGGTVMHSHNFRKPDSEEFEGKNVLFVGIKWSGMDLMYQFLDNKRLNGAVKFKKLILNVKEPERISKSDNFKKFYDDGSVVVKIGEKLELKKDSVIFEDGSEEKVDTILFCTGYKFKFPFLDKADLISYDADNRYYGPLYQKIFSINDPTLMFAGQGDSNALIQVVMEKQIIVIKNFIAGYLKMPPFEEMHESLNEDLKHFESLGIRNFYKGSVSYQLKYIEELRDLLKTNNIEPSCANQKFNTGLMNMIKIFGETLKDANFIDFKNYPYQDCLNGDFEFDSSDYF